MKKPLIPLLALVCVIALFCIAATQNITLRFYTDLPNTTPTDGDFLAYQRNQAFVNSTVAQLRQFLFTSPSFTGNGFVPGQWHTGSILNDGIYVGSGILYGNGAGLTNVPGISGNFFASTNGVGQNPTFYGGGSFFGTYYFDEVDTLNFYPTNLFLGLTNSPYLATDGNGKPITGTGLSPTNVLLSAGANISFTTNMDGSVTIAGSSTATNTTTIVQNLSSTYITNSTEYTTNIWITLGYATNFYITTNLVNTEYVTNQYVTTSFITNLTVLQTISGNKITVTNVTIQVGGGFTNNNWTANTMLYSAANKDAQSLANGGNNTVLHGTTPPTYGSVANADLANSSITIQGSAVALGGSTLAAGSTPAFGGINFTNLGYGLPTNNVGGGAFAFGGPGTAATLYDTNITAATTLKLFDITACGATAGGIKLYVTCSGGTDRILTFPSGCSGAGLGTPPAVTITNAKAAFFDVIYKPGATPVTNVFWSPVY